MPARIAWSTWTAASILPDPFPTWWGHSIGWWSGDTLVIDTVGYNDKFWFDARGTPHTEQLHTVERWTRINYGTLVTISPSTIPARFSKPVQLKFTANLAAPGIDLMEYICTENNQLGYRRRLPAEQRRQAGAGSSPAATHR